MGSIAAGVQIHPTLSKPIKVKQPWRETPLIESANLSKAAGCRVFLKLENLQPAGSFKSRGLGRLVSRHQAERAIDPSRTHFYSSSGGNAGLACVVAARAVGRPATVVVPETTPEHMLAKIRAAGASAVLRQGVSWKEADHFLREALIPLAAARGEEPVYVSPFDHPDIWEGHATMMGEVDAQLAAQGDAPPDVVVCSCGGGGLFVGTAMGIEQLAAGPAPDWARTQLVVVNTAGSDALPQSLAAGELVTIPAITTIAKSLGCSRVAAKALEYATKGIEKGTLRNVVLTDAEAAMGTWRLADDERMLVEPACGVSVALCYGDRMKKALGRPVRPEDKVVIVVCGGQNISSEVVEGWRVQYGDLDHRPADDVPSSITAPGAQ